MYKDHKAAIKKLQAIKRRGETSINIKIDGMIEELRKYDDEMNRYWHIAVFYKDIYVSSDPAGDHVGESYHHFTIGGNTRKELEYILSHQCGVHRRALPIDDGITLLGCALGKGRRHGGEKEQCDRQDFTNRNIHKSIQSFD